MVECFIPLCRRQAFAYFGHKGRLRCRLGWRLRLYREQPRPRWGSSGGRSEEGERKEAEGSVGEHRELNVGRPVE